MSTEPKRLLIVGSGGHARSVADAVLRAGEYELAGFVSPDPVGQDVYMGYSVIGHDEDLAGLYRSGIEQAVIGIGFTVDNRVRARVIRKLLDLGFLFPVIIEPSAVIARDVELAEGVFVGKQAVINSRAAVGRFAIINTASVVEHDCSVGTSSHIAVAAVLSGNVTVGDDVLVGANATVIQSLQVADRCTIGAGAVITRSITSKGSLVVGHNRYIEREG